MERSRRGVEESEIVSLPPSQLIMGTPSAGPEIYRLEAETRRAPLIAKKSANFLV